MHWIRRKKDESSSPPIPPGVEITMGAAGRFIPTGQRELGNGWSSFDGLVRAAGTTSATTRSALTLALYGSYSILSSKPAKRIKAGATPAEQQQMWIVSLLAVKRKVHFTLHVWMVGDAAGSEPQAISLDRFASSVPIAPAADRLGAVQAIAAQWVGDQQQRIIGAPNGNAVLRPKPEPKGAYCVVLVYCVFAWFC